jgi:hypothetical protein
MRSKKLSKPLNDFCDLFWVVFRQITAVNPPFSKNAANVSIQILRKFFQEKTFGESPFLRGSPITVTLVVSGKMYDAY